MQKSYLAKITFDDNAMDGDGRKVSLTWPDGSQFNLSALDGPANVDHQLVEEMLWRGVGNKLGVGVKVIAEIDPAGNFMNG